MSELTTATKANIFNVFKDMYQTAGLELEISPRLEKEYIEDVKNTADNYTHIKNKGTRFWSMIAMEASIDRICRIYGDHSPACVQVKEFTEPMGAPPPMGSNPPSPVVEKK
jgi:hypothetical protein